MRGVIFDFNGTMVFDEKFHAQAWRRLIKEKGGVKISDEEYQKYCQGVNADIILEKFGIERDNDIKKIKRFHK